TRARDTQSLRRGAIHGRAQRMNLCGRLDRIEEAIGVGQLWDGTTVEALCRYGYFDPDGEAGVDIYTGRPAPFGAQRCAEYVGILIAVDWLRDPDLDPEKAAEVRQQFDLADDDGPDVIIGRLMEHARAGGFTDRELKRVEGDLEEFFGLAGCPIPPAH